MTFGLRCSGPACRPHPASLPVRVPTVESLPPASFGFPLAVAPCGLATVAVIGPDWLLSSNKTLPMLGTPRGRPPGRPASRRTRASAAVQGTAPPSRCQSDYRSQADTPIILFLLIEVRLGFGEHIVLTGDPHVEGGQQENIEQHGYHEPAHDDNRSEE